jgi:hypothetical protein
VAVAVAAVAELLGHKLAAVELVVMGLMVVTV